MLLYYKILILELVANAIDISWYFQGVEDFGKTVLMPGDPLRSKF